MNNNTNRKSHARRRPESITYGNSERQVRDHSEARQSSQSANKTQRSGMSPRQTQSIESGRGAQHDVSERSNPAYRGDGQGNAAHNTLKSGQSRTSSRAMQVAEVDNKAMRREEKRLIKQEQKLIKSERREEEWQRDIVRVRGGVDKFLLTLIIVLIVLGSITVFSASYPYAVREGLESYAFIVDQIKFILIGTVGLLVTYFFPMKFYKTFVPPIAYAVAVLLLIAALFIGTKEGVTTRWIDLGPINIQPSEVMKVALILMIAWYVEHYRDKMRDLDRGVVSLWWNTLVPDLIVGLACGFVLFGKHLSGTIIVGAIGVSILMVAGCKIAWLLETIVPVAVVAIAAYLLNNKYALERLTSFGNENADKLDELYQTTQSIYAIGSGGLLGVGLGASRQKHSYLGAAHTDFIFSIWCEELGFIGAVALIILFILFIWRGYVISLRSPDKFTMLVSFGITTHIGIQAFLNMCVAADIFPNTGVTLPFFSYGGSALVITMAEMGILLKISRQYYRKRADIEHDEMERRAGLL